MLKKYLINNIRKNVEDIFDVKNVNDFINNLKVTDNSKRMYSYFYQKELKENDKNELIKDVVNFKQKSERKLAISYENIWKVKKLLKDEKEEFIFTLFYETGIRIGEYFQINFEKIKENFVEILTEKSNKVRYVFVSEKVLNLSKKINWKFSEKQIRYIFKKISKKANENNIVNFEITPHTLRHTCASALIVLGVNISDVSLYLGDTVMTVAKYYVTQNPDYMKNIGKMLTENWEFVFDLDKAKKQIFDLNKKIEILKNEKEELLCRIKIFKSQK